MSYVYGSYIDEPVLRYEPATSESRYYHRNQQYSIIALTDGVGAISERYAYSAYGELTVPDGSGTVQSGSDNRYTYTGRGHTRCQDSSASTIYHDVRFLPR